MIIIRCEWARPARRRIGRPRTRGAVLGILLPVLDEPEDHEQRDEDRDPDERVHAALNSPAKPMNARDRLPAMRKMSAAPRATDGTSAKSTS
jgi:hypothetical protein